MPTLPATKTAPTARWSVAVQFAYFAVMGTFWATAQPVFHAPLDAASAHQETSPSVWAVLRATTSTQWEAAWPVPATASPARPLAAWSACTATPCFLIQPALFLASGHALLARMDHPPLAPNACTAG